MLWQLKSGMHAICGTHSEFVETVDLKRGQIGKLVTLPAFLALLNAKSHNLTAMLQSLKISAALTKDIFDSLPTGTEEEMREQEEDLIWLCQMRRGKEMMGQLCQAGEHDSKPHSSTPDVGVLRTVLYRTGCESSVNARIVTAYGPQLCITHQFICYSR